MDIDEQDKWGCTAVWRGAEKGHPSVIKTCVELGADLDMVAQGGQSPIAAACRFVMPRNTECIKLLIESGANPNLGDVDGNTPLMVAALVPNPPSVQCLIDMGCDVDAQAVDGSTAAVRAACNGMAGTLHQIVKGGADLSIGDLTGRAPLHAAAIENQLDCARVLFDACTDVNVRRFAHDASGAYGSGSTPLSEAARRGHVAMCQLLLAHGADPNIGSDCAYYAAQVPPPSPRPAPPPRAPPPPRRPSRVPRASPGARRYRAATAPLPRHYAAPRRSARRSVPSLHACRRTPRRRSLSPSSLGRHPHRARCRVLCPPLRRTGSPRPCAWSSPRGAT